MCRWPFVVVHKALFGILLLQGLEPQLKLACLITLPFPISLSFLVPPRCPRVPAQNGKIEKGPCTKAWLSQLICCKAHKFGIWCSLSSQLQSVQCWCKHNHSCSPPVPARLVLGHPAPGGSGEDIHEGRSSGLKGVCWRQGPHHILPFTVCASSCGCCRCNSDLGNRLSHNRPHGVEQILAQQCCPSLLSPPGRCPHDKAWHSTVSTAGPGSHLWRWLTAWPRASHLAAPLHFLTLLNARDNK